MTDTTGVESGPAREANEGETGLAAMMRPGSLQVSLRSWLAGGALLVCCVIVGLSLVGTLHERSVAIAVARIEAENLAASLAGQASDTFEAVDGVLLALAQRTQSEGSTPADRERMHESMAALVRAMPRLHDVFLLDRFGRLVVSNASAELRPDLRFADRPYFMYHRTHAIDSLHISGPARSGTEDTWVILATRRINNPDGSFGGVVVAQIALDYFKQSYAKVDVGRDGAIALLADDGMVMFRKPQIPVGRMLRNSTVFKDPYKYEESGSFVAPSAVDGVRRLTAFRRLDTYPLLVWVSLADHEYLAEWRGDAVKKFAALAVVLALIGGLVSVLSVQIDRRKRAEDDLAQLALMDGLTGLANRRQFDAVLEREWRRAARDRNPLALLMIDVDNFKAFNDLYGHLPGDDALTLIARTIAGNLGRGSDLAARYGGEEFAVILPGIDGSSALIVAERIRRAVAALSLPHHGSPLGVATVSIGAASVAPVSFAEPAALVEAADSALYDAKGRGRDQTVLAVAWNADVAEPPRADQAAANAIALPDSA